MTIENFSREQFETALPAGRWTYAGIRNSQHCYKVKPFDGKPFAIFVWSSVLQSGESSHEAGNDSIRAVIVDEGGIPYGGKANRWIDRRPGWDRRLLETLRTLAAQIRAICPCPVCGTMGKPFTCGKPGPNKGRSFISCPNNACAGKGNRTSLFKWMDEETPAKASSVSSKASEPVKPGTCSVSVLGNDLDEVRRLRAVISKAIVKAEAMDTPEGEALANELRADLR